MAVEIESAGEDYCELLQDEIESRVASVDGAPGSVGGTTYTEQVFTEWCAELLEENAFIAGFEPAPWEFTPPAHGPQMKVNGFHIPETGELMVDVFVTDWRVENPEASELTRKQVDSLVTLGVTFLQKALSGTAPLYKILEPAHSHAALAESLWSRREEIRRITLHVFMNRLAPQAEVDARMLGDIPLSVDIWDAKRLVRLNEGRVERRDEIVVEFPEGLPCVHCPETDGRYEAYLTILPGRRLAEIYERYGPRILQENVRAFLQLSVGVNKGIRKTLQDEPGAFFAYNNGLSATAREVATVESGAALKITSITGLQIVNGAQTTGSLHRAWRAGETSLENVHVPVKLNAVTEDARGEMVARISQYANSQTAVKLDDFSANRPFHVRLEELSRRIWTPPRGEHRWYYERTRGQYQDELQRQDGAAAARKFRQENPPGQRFTKTDVARYIHAWDGKPHLVSLGAQKNFVKFSADWLKDGWLPDDAWFRELIAKAIVVNSVRGCVRQAALAAYGANVIAYIVALLGDRFGARLDLSAIWEAQTLVPETRSWLQSWSRPVYDQLVQSAEGRNVTEWCKKPGCWEASRSMALPEPSGAIPELKPVDATDLSNLGRGPGSAEVPVTIDFSDDRAVLLRLAKEVVDGRALRREDAVKELQSRLGIGRLTAEKRADLESAFDDLAQIAFIDDEATVHTNTGLAVARKAMREGIRTRDALLSTLAKEWLGKQRLGSNVRAEGEKLLGVASRRLVTRVEGESVSCPTGAFDDYADEFLQETLLAIVRRRGRVYLRTDAAEAVVRYLGFTHARADMLQRVDRVIEAALAARVLECPAIGQLRRSRPEEP